MTQPTKEKLIAELERVKEKFHHVVSGGENGRYVCFEEIDRCHRCLIEATIVKLKQ
jgi:hypothetical protein